MKKFLYILFIVDVLLMVSLIFLKIRYHVDIVVYYVIGIAYLCFYSLYAKKRGGK